MPVGLRTKSIAARMPALARIPASCPAPVARTGASPSRRASRAARLGVERVTRSTTPRSRGRRGDVGDDARTASESAPRASSQRSRATGSRSRRWVRPAPCRRWPLRRAVRPRRAPPDTSASASIGSCRSASLVVPAWLASPSGRRATDRAARSTADRDRPAEVDETAALFYVQFDEDTTRRNVSSSRPTWRIVPGAAHRFGEVDTVAVGSASARSGVDAPVSSREPCRRRRTERPPRRRS